MSTVLWSVEQGGDLRVVPLLASLTSRAERAGFPARVAVQGIAIGGCAEALGTSRAGALRPSAHAHTQAGPRFGWLCFKSRSPERVVTATGRATRLFVHEWAHIHLRHGHTERYVRLLRAVGQEAEARTIEGYRRRKVPPPINRRST